MLRSQTSSSPSLVTALFLTGAWGVWKFLPGFPDPFPRPGTGPLDGSVSVQEPRSRFPGQLHGSLSCRALEKLRD